MWKAFYSHLSLILETKKSRGNKRLRKFFQNQNRKVIAALKRRNGFQQLTTRKSLWGHMTSPTFLVDFRFAGILPPAVFILTERCHQLEKGNKRAKHKVNHFWFKLEMLSKTNSGEKAINAWIYRNINDINPPPMCMCVCVCVLYSNEELGEKDR